MIDTKIISPAVNNFQSVALIGDGLHLESLLPLWRIPSRDSGHASSFAPTPYLTPGHIGPATRT